MKAGTFRRPATAGPGSILGVDRGAFDHYGVLVRDGRVIHYTSSQSDISGDMLIRKTPAHHFLRNADNFWTMKLPTEADAHRILDQRFDEIMEPVSARLNGAVGAIAAAGLKAAKALAVSAILDGYHIYGPEEVQERAHSRLGEHKYNIAIHNCEHFAFWCATGLSSSQQVEGLLYGGAALVALVIEGAASTAFERLVDPRGREGLGGHGLFERSSPIPSSVLLRTS